MVHCYLLLRGYSTVQIMLLALLILNLLYLIVILYLAIYCSWGTPICATRCNVNVMQFLL